MTDEVCKLCGQSVEAHRLGHYCGMFVTDEDPRTKALRTRIAELEAENKRLISHVVRVVLERDNMRASLKEVLPLSCEYSCERDGTGTGEIAVHSDVCERARAALQAAGGKQ